MNRGCLIIWIEVWSNLENMLIKYLKITCRNKKTILADSKARATKRTSIEHRSEESCKNDETLKNELIDITCSAPYKFSYMSISEKDGENILTS